MTLSTPILASEYESLWYRWTSFQDTKDDKNLYVQCGVEHLNGQYVSFEDFKIIKKGSNKYDLYQIVDDNWLKRDATFNALSVSFDLEDKKVQVWNVPYFDQKNWTSADELYSIITNPYRFETFSDPLPLDFEQTQTKNRIFDEYLEIKNKIPIVAKLNFHTSYFSEQLKSDSSSSKLDQPLRFWVKKDIGDIRAGVYWKPTHGYWEDLTSREFYYQNGYECLALKRA